MSDQDVPNWFRRDWPMLALYTAWLVLSVTMTILVMSDIARAVWALAAAGNGFNIGMRVASMLARRGNLPVARVVERPEP